MEITQGSEPAKYPPWLCGERIRKFNARRTLVSPVVQTEKFPPEYYSGADLWYMNDKASPLNPVLNDMIMRGQLSEAKVSELVVLKAIVDDFALVPYLSKAEEERLVNKYGESPNILTWGDYFQTEVGSRYFHYSDLEFKKVVETVRFDLISSVMIFKSKTDDFMEEVKASGLAVNAIPQEEWSEEQQQSAHLFILYNYYLELSLENKELNGRDYKWFENFTAVGSLNVQAG